MWSLKSMWSSASEGKERVRKAGKMHPKGILLTLHIGELEREKERTIAAGTI